MIRRSDEANPDFADLSARVYRLCLAMLGNEADAQDAAQESLTRAWSRRQKKRPAVTWWTWTGGFAVRVCRETRKRRSAQLVGGSELTEAQSERAASAVNGATTSELAAVKGETSSQLAKVNDAVMALPDRQREVTVLRFILGLSTQQTAEMLGCPAGTVKSNLFKAIAKMKTVITTTEAVDDLPSV
ncbi:MAG: sigma-70 family RNA polymerase sigma factor [Phycisphaerales bacterium]|nr:MAG: sigma-70 family RNA polymerase sigma factor [Phycisphaerales bacterium]